MKKISTKFVEVEPGTIKVEGKEFSRREIEIMYGKEVLFALCIASVEGGNEVNIDIEHSQEELKKMIERHKKMIKEKEVIND